MPEPDLRLDFVLSGDDGIDDVADADETDLRYDFLLGDLVFEIGDADLSAPWGWVPILDMALALRDAVQTLASEDEVVLGFTENDATIRFVREGGRIRAIASYGDDMVAPLVGLPALTNAVETFGRAVCATAVERAPAIAENEAFLRIASDLRG